MKNKYIEQIKHIESVFVEEDFDFGLLKSSFKVSGIVKYYIHTNNLSSLKKISKIISENSLKYTAVGGGSNLLINNYYDGIFLEYTDNRILEFTDKDNDFILRAFAGIKKQDLLKRAIDLNLSGLEFLAGIPGKLGGGIAMNAGAYGSEFKDIIKRVAVCSKGDGHFYDINDLDIKYRDFNYPQKPYLITFADIKLKKSSKEKIQNLINKNLINKKQSQPLEYPSAGSIFKNPKTKKTAWWYIKELGLAGLQKEGAQISEKHANFIINIDNAKSSDIVYLINLAKEKVQKQFNINLKEEVQIF